MKDHISKYKSAHAIAYFKLIEVSHKLEAKIKLTLKERKLTHGQYNVLRILRGARGTPLSANTVKDRMIVSNPDVTRLIDRLLKKHLVNRVKSPDNLRKVDITISEKGLDLLSELDPVMKSTAFDFFEKEISDLEVIDLVRILDKMIFAIK